MPAGIYELTKVNVKMTIPFFNQIPLARNGRGGLTFRLNQICFSNETLSTLKLIQALLWP